MARPICKIAQETGEVPLTCLFGCQRNCAEDYRDYEKAMRVFFDDPDEPAPAYLAVHCPACGSTDVRWRQQGGRWVLFDLQPGVEHVCPVEELLKDFD